MGINATLNTARLGLTANQMGIDVTAANVTNVNTPGYVRQRAELIATGTVDVSSKNFQVGVDIAQVQRIYDRYLESQVVEKTTDSGYSATKQGYLQRIDGIFNETNGGGINDLLSNFWASWQNLSANPQGMAEGTVVVSAAEDLSSLFREYSDDLNATMTDAGDEASQMIESINSDIEKIGELNAQIIAQRSDKGDTNVLMDERSKLLTSVAEAVGVNYIEDSNGNIALYLAGGDSLVQGASVRKLEMVGNDIRIEGTTEPITSTISTGKLGALIELRDQVLPGYLNSLNALAAGIVDSVNEQHSKGYTMGGAVGGDFFVPVAYAGTAARQMRVNEEIAANAGMIAAASTVDGDGENAGLIGALSDHEIDWGASSSTMNGFYGTLTAQVGSDVSNAVSRNDHEKIIMTQLEEQRDSFSGVSIDEEMMNLIKYQMGYSAAGRLVTVANELMDALINLGK